MQSDGEIDTTGAGRKVGGAQAADLHAVCPSLDAWTAVSVILAHSPYPVQVCDTTGRNLYVNDAYRTVFGQPAGDRTLPAAAEPPHAVAAPLIRRALAGDTVEMPVAWYVPEAAGNDDTPARAVYGSLRAFPLRAEDGSIALVVIQFTDRSGEKVQELDHLRDRFIAAASHELRTPLTTLLGYTQLLVRRLQRGDGAERLQPSAVNILRAGRRLDRLVNQLIDVSRLDQGTLTLHPEACDLRKLIAEVVEEIVVRDPGRPVRLDAPDSLQGRCDAGRIEQVIYSLLDNAVRYGRPESAIDVCLRDAGDVAMVRVENEGDPIDESVIAEFFDRSAHRVEQEPPFAAGLGLGLHMSRAIVHAHGGTITAAARPGGGLSVTVTLPWRARTAGRDAGRFGRR